MCVIIPQKLFANVAKEIISYHSPDDPMFMYLSFQSVHSPLQVPKVYEDLYQNIRDEKRRKYCGMVTAMDTAVGVVVDALKENDLWDNSILVFTSDNGGQTVAGGNNWPYRGNKGTLWEGGTKAVTFIQGPYLKKKGYVNNKLFHAVDWFPTLLSISGAEPVLGIDGMDQSAVIIEDGKAVRKEIVYNIYDLDEPKAAIRINNYKLIQGFPGKPVDWLAPAEDIHTKSIYCSLKNNNSQESTFETLRLYDLKGDPLERVNIAQKFPKVVQKMKARIDELRISMAPADDPPQDERGEPKLWGNTFSPGWCIAK